MVGIKMFFVVLQLCEDLSWSKVNGVTYISSHEYTSLRDEAEFTLEEPMKFFTLRSIRSYCHGV